MRLIVSKHHSIVLGPAEQPHNGREPIWDFRDENISDNF